MAKGNGAEFGENLMDAFGITEPRQGTGPGGVFRIGRDSQGNPGIQMMGKFIPFSEFKESGGGGGGADENDGGGEKTPPIKDIDYPINARKKASLSDIYKPKVKPTMKAGGLVRGAGCAQRGQGRGKIV